MSDRQSKADDELFFATLGCLLPTALLFTIAAAGIIIVAVVIF